MDIISFNEAATANSRIEKFIENPDSTSGIVTVPKTIATGETVTVPAGRVAVLPNVVVDGTLNIDGEVFIPSGSSVDFSNGIKIDGNNIALSIPTSYHLLQGDLSVSNEVITNGFNTTLYTGNGGTQAINTGVDMATQWGDDASEMFGGLVWLKSRSIGNHNALYDSVRGALKVVYSSATNAESTLANSLTGFTSTGFVLASDGANNTNLATQASWNFQTTHRKTGVTNHGKAYTEHYNPFTGFTIIKYEGSGLAGHEIPHSLGRKLGFVTVKNLSSAIGWQAQYREGYILTLNATSAEVSTTTGIALLNDLVSTVGTDSTVNTSTNQYIMYGWANSYFDADNTLIGNYLTTIDGNGILRLSVHTNVSQSQIMWQMSKTTLTTGDWDIVDFTRGNTKELNANLPAIESTITANALVTTASPATYVKATDTSNVQINNAIIPLAHGVDSNGSKNSIVVANETITGLTYTTGKNYLYKTDTGYGVKSIPPSYGKVNPLIGDFYNVITNKWYSNTNVEIIESRNYLNHIVHADANGQVAYVEELPKTTYFDRIETGNNRKVMYLSDYGISAIQVNKRYVLDNPFGNDRFMDCDTKLEIYDAVISKWIELGSPNTTDGTQTGYYGAKCMSTIDGLVIQTAISYLVSTAVGVGLLPYSPSSALTSAPARVTIQFNGKTGRTR